MALHLTRHFHRPARLLMSIIFLLSGVGKLGAVEVTQKYMEAYGVPGYLLYPAAFFDIGSGIMLLLGSLTRHLSVVLAGWCMLTAFIFHKKFDDQNQTINFLKNTAMAGGFLVLADSDAPGASLAAGPFSSRKDKTGLKHSCTVLEALRSRKDEFT
ncbi:hypothetical protein B0A49_04702 [Cryomyces minteri]|uniref:DoxX family protein n=1 Tax=Cryomyces minteri TaxID=331657 RepID=A0A4U0XQ90_9PEZI|nr:hypothetical protein B0A49_04702 [Cryomyces minteri]